MCLGVERRNEAWRCAGRHCDDLYPLSVHCGILQWGYLRHGGNIAPFRASKLLILALSAGGFQHGMFKQGWLDILPPGGFVKATDEMLTDCQCV